MKSGCLFSICAFLLIIQHVSATCTPFLGDKSKTCPAQCAWYTCGLPEVYKTGCPADFERDCINQTESVKFINSRNSYDLEYVNIKENVQYFSGCSDAGANGTDSLSCFQSAAFSDKTKVSKSDFCLEGGKPCGAPATETTTPVSGSSEQNGALKLIGILAFGWMLLSAAWIQ
uniref:Uncharacterized protein n=1 Tax=Panagrolaimus davidi TaxID=227884 RepID=A0A914R410_9BILA